jgi:hypothetical protein
MGEQTRVFKAFLGSYRYREYASFSALSSFFPLSLSFPFPSFPVPIPYHLLNQLRNKQLIRLLLRLLDPLHIQSRLLNLDL